MGYEQMAQTALRSVVRMALERVAAQGLPGDHHFYITFDTRHADVRIADYLRQRYPEDMTIVLQHQFWGLKVGEEHFEVTLSFNKVGEHLVIPYAALRSFFDPSVQFGLQFKTALAAAGAAKRVPGPAPQKALPGRPAAQAGLPKPEALPVDADKPAASADVVNLDAFRKK